MIQQPYPTHLDVRTFSDFVRMVVRMYKKINKIHYTPEDLVGKIGRYASIACKFFEEGKTDLIWPSLTTALSWAMAVANRLEIYPDREIALRYPGCCPYCTEVICVCEKGNKGKRKVFDAGQIKSKTIVEVQAMLKALYPKNTTGSAFYHVWQEIEELREAVLDYMKHVDDPAREDKIKEELTDIICWILAIFSCEGECATRRINWLYKNGTACPCCDTSPCARKFTIAQPDPALLVTHPVGS